MTKEEARFAEYDRVAESMRQARLRLVPLHKRWLFMTIGDIVRGLRKA